MVSCLGSSASASVQTPRDVLNEVEPDDHLQLMDPLRSARMFLTSKPNLRFWRGEWYDWHVEAGVYSIIQTEELRRDVRNSLHAYLDSEAPDSERPVVNDKFINEVLSVARENCILAPALDAPFWIGPQQPNTWRAVDCLAFRDALVHLPSWIASLNCVSPALPAYFSCYALPYSIADVDFGAPTRFLHFLNTQWDNDPTSVGLLQEWCGYLLLPDARWHKALVIYGEPRSGKGVISRLLSRLLGQHLVTGFTFADMGTAHGLQGFVAKRLAIAGDMRQQGRSAALSVERFLAVTGGDAVMIDPKYQTPYSTRLPLKFMILSNGVPLFPDTTGAVANRLLGLKTTVSFVGREDRELEDKIANSEMPQILGWALQGLKRLIGSQQFTINSATEHLISTVRRTAAPVIAFAEDKCQRGQSFKLPCDQLYKAFRRWCEDEGHKKCLTREQFGSQIQDLPGVSRKQQRVNCEQVWFYLGIDLNENFPRS